jgi:hypothetical protein
MLCRQKQLSRAAEKAKGEDLRGDRTRLDTFHKIEVTLGPLGAEINDSGLAGSPHDRLTRSRAAIHRVGNWGSVARLYVQSRVHSINP